MSAEDSARKILSRKELAKEQRREAYRKAKERRDNDPRFIAMKEAAKKQRREAYQKAKQQRKAAEAEAKLKTRKVAPLDREQMAAEARRKLESLAAVRTAEDRSTARDRARPGADESSHTHLELEPGLLAGWQVKGSRADN